MTHEPGRGSDATTQPDGSTADPPSTDGFEHPTSNPTPSPSASGASTPPALEAAAPTCELCGATMLDRHCKVVCLNCGYMRDCSDP